MCRFTCKHITFPVHIKKRSQRKPERRSHFLPPGRLKWQNRDQIEGNYGTLHSSFKGFLLTSLPFRQGLNSSKIIAVMSKGNLPQTEAGSSEAVAPGKAELLSFLKCQRGTGTGSTSPQCAVISSSSDSALKDCCPKQEARFIPKHVQVLRTSFAMPLLRVFDAKYFFYLSEHFPLSTRHEFIHNPWQ